MTIEMAMTIEMPAAEVYALGAALHGQGHAAADVAARLDVSAAVGGHLQPALAGFLECHGAAARALAGELHWLGSTVRAVADSWLGLDGTLLATPWRRVPQ